MLLVGRFISYVFAIAVTWLALFVLLDAHVLGVKLGEHGHVAVGTTIFALVRSISTYGENYVRHVRPTRARVEDLLSTELPKLEKRQSRDKVPWSALRDGLTDMKRVDEHYERAAAAALSELNGNATSLVYNGIDANASWTAAQALLRELVGMQGRS